MKNKNLRGILALAVVTALSFGVILGSRALSHNINGNTAGDLAAAETEKVLEELDITGAETIEKAAKTEDGYLVTVRTKGYVGDILMNVFFDAEAKKVTKVEVLEQQETEGAGSLIAEADFLSQFEGVEAPVYLPGMTLEAGEDKPAEKTEPAVLTDGTYEAKTKEADQSGFIGEVSMTIEDGRIASAAWDYTDAEGNKKSVLSETGGYVMTEDGPTWKEQAEAVAAALVAEQSLDFFNMQENGKIDTVSGVSISIAEFVSLAEECLREAAGETAVVEEAAPQNGTQVDAVSGATISSKAAVKGINEAYNFLQTVR